MEQNHFHEYSMGIKFVMELSLSGFQDQMSTVLQNVHNERDDPPDPLYFQEVSTQ